MSCASQAGAQWADTTITVTSGNFDDIDPAVDDAGRSYPQVWLAFERWYGGSDAIDAVRFDGNTLKWDSTAITVSPQAGNIIQKYPDVCTEASGVSLAAWQQKTDSVWDIDYSVFDPIKGMWSKPAALMNDTVSNTSVEVRSLPDTSVVLIWKRLNSILFSVCRYGRFSRIDTFVVSNTDSTQFDFEYNGLVWTDKSGNGNRYCLLSTILNDSTLSLSVPDTFSAPGDMSDPRFQIYNGTVGKTFTTDVNDGILYQVWGGPFFGSGFASLAASDSSSYLHGIVESFPILVTSNHVQDQQQGVYGYLAVERVTRGDTSFEFETASQDSIESGMLPAISTTIFSDRPLGLVTFLVWQSDESGRYQIYSRDYLYQGGNAINEPKNLATNFHLYQNYLNPFNPSTVIQFEVPSFEFVSLKVYDVLGRLVRTLVDKMEQPGSYSVTFDTNGLASGVYLYTLQAGSHSQIRKAILLR